DEYEAAWPAALEAAKQAVKDEHEEVLNTGGLYVLGTERHESRRIDNQLRGRSGRQGDPGESRFYLSLTDDLMRLFNSGAAERLMNSSVPDDVALESKLVSRAIASAQGQVEGRNAEQRKNVLKYDDVLNRQREAIYGDRRRILEGDDLHEKVQFFLEDTINAFIEEATAEGTGDDWDFNLLWSNLKTLYPVSFTPRDVIDEAGGKSRITVDFLKEEILSDARLVYQAREEGIGSESMRELERRVVLSVIGRKWQEHLYEMDYLKEGIGLRAMAQRDPLVEYQREGFIMFQAMMEAIREESVGFLFNLEVKVSPAEDLVVADTAGQHTEHHVPQIHAAGLQAPEKPAQLQYTAPGEDGAAQTRIEAKSSGRSGNPAKAAGQDAGRRTGKKKRR
ncbi:MAG TPA: preprotein translocase subunit SecA, partial [Arthrobacter sp.]|nr:preprotein translocase subunit SecA [Arthrobacter sp.]